MDDNCFDYLLYLMKPYITKKDIVMHQEIRKTFSDS